MEKRQLGKSTLMVAPLCFGGNVFGWTADEKTSFALLDAWVDAGMDFIDTADVYSRWVPGHSGGESETILGKWFRQSGKRNRVTLATKVGMEMPGKGKGLAPKYIARAIEDSLRRLQTDHVDLYQSHQDDPETPLEETLHAYDRLIAQGKVRAIGASNYSGARLKEALDLSERTGLPRYDSLQPKYNLYDRAEYEKDLEPLCLEHKVGVINYYGLAAGFLTGKYRGAADKDKSTRGASMDRYLNPRGMRILAALDEVAGRHKSTPAAVALAWQMARPSITAPIASATSVAQLTQLLAATRLQLGADDLALLDRESAESTAATQ